MKRLVSVVGRFGKGLVIGFAIASIYYILLYVSPGASAVWMASLAPVLLVGFLVGYRVPDDVVIRWSKSHGVPITDENRDVLMRHLNRGRRIRTAGAVLGFVGYMIFTVEVAKDDASWGVLRSTFFGYLIGAGFAELWSLRLRPHGRTAASLLTRRVRDYVPRSALILLGVATMTTVGLAIAWEWVPHGDQVARIDRRPGVGWAGGWAGLTVLVTLFVLFTIRGIVRRPQPAVSEELIRVDDAIRSSSIHQLLGAGLALTLGILSARLGDLSPDSTPEGIRSLFADLGGLTGLASIIAWLHLGIDQKWVVLRSNPRRQGAAA